MIKYTVTLSDAEHKALGFVTVSQQDWIENVVRARCISAIDDIVNIEVQRLLAEGKPITGSKEDIVLAAEIESAAKRQEKIEAEMAALRAQEQQGE
jgi:hypothetical protein